MKFLDASSIYVWGYDSLKQKNLSKKPNQDIKGDCYWSNGD